MHEEEADTNIAVYDELDFINDMRRLDGDDSDDDLFSFAPKRKNPIALNVTTMEGSGNDSLIQGGWTVPKKQRANLKKKIRKELQSSDRMLEQEANQINDLWDMTVKNKWRLYRFWTDK